MRKAGMAFVYLGIVAWIGAVAIPAGIHERRHQVNNSASTTGDPRVKLAESILFVGGSVSHGWDDKVGKGFLRRTTGTLNRTTSVKYSVYDKTIVGANEVQLQDTLYEGDYEKWLFWFQPKVVVLAWGLLNDCLPKTPMPVFDTYIKQEINEALKQKSVVWVVTPPVTRASYTKYKVQEQAYVDEEIHIVKSMNNPNVRIYNVFNEMKQYLMDHHQTYVPYMSNGWHPNSAGHALAAQLLLKDIKATYGTAPPTFQSPNA